MFNILNSHVAIVGIKVAFQRLPALEILRVHRSALFVAVARDRQAQGTLKHERHGAICDPLRFEVGPRRLLKGLRVRSVWSA